MKAANFTSKWYTGGVFFDFRIRVTHTAGVRPVLFTVVGCTMCSNKPIADVHFDDKAMITGVRKPVMRYFLKTHRI